MKVPQKWRPSLGLMIAVVVGVLVLLPFAALVGARVTSNQFVQETEASLHAQAAIYSAVYARAFEAIEPDPTVGAVLGEAQRARLLENFHPVDPNLVSSSRSILPPRPDPVEAAGAPAAPYRALTAPLSEIASTAQKTTLVGFLALDHQGRIIAKSGKDVGSLAHVDEVARALKGEITSAARWRVEEYRNHSIRSISRDTKFRVYVAHPVIVAERVVGVIYLSRTPSNLNKYLFQQRNAFMWLVASVALSAGLIGLFLWRILTRPLSALQEQAANIARGEDRSKLPSYGAKELASLGQSLMDMGASLRKKTAALEAYTKHATHELKSPVTSIMGAAELLENSTVSDERRAVLAGNIKADAARMDRLLLRMRELARGQTAFEPEETHLAEVVSAIAPAFPRLLVSTSGDIEAVLPVVRDAMEICLRHLLENAQEHEAKSVEISFDHAAQVLALQDDGSGISQANQSKAVEPFFTTKRERGGTGMGLSICAEVIAQFGGKLEIEDTGQGARVTMRFAPD